MGFSQVHRGLTFKNYNSSTRYTSTSTDVIFHGLHEQLDPSYPRRNIDEHIQANWCFDDSHLLNFGTNYNSSIGWNLSSLSLVSSGTITLQNSLSNITFTEQTITPSLGINLGTSSTIFNSLYISTISSGDINSSGNIEGNWTLTTGNLTLHADPTANLQAATKQYVDNIGSSNTSLANLKVSKSGDTMTGPLTLNADPISNLQAATKQYVDDSEARIIPRGIISMWSGSLQTIPNGWHLCDGTNGTPNLIDRFIVGAGSSYSTGQTGGSNSAVTDDAGSHNHSGATTSHQLTVDELPAHSHTINDPGHHHTYHTKGTTYPQSGNSTWCWYGDSTMETSVETTGITINNTGANLGHNHGISSDGTHNHNVTVIPYFFALAYIMKL